MVDKKGLISDEFCAGEGPGIGIYAGYVKEAIAPAGGTAQTDVGYPQDTH